MPRFWRTILAVAFLLSGAVLSFFLLLQHHGAAHDSAFVLSVCGGEGSGCDVVNRSELSDVGGVSLAALGLLFYLSLALLLVLSVAGDQHGRQASTSLALLLVTLGFVVDLVLLGVQAFHLKTFCRLCLLTYLSSVGALAMLWPSRRFLGEWRSLGRSINVRMLGAAWVCCSLCLSLAVGAGEWALRLSAQTPHEAISGDQKAVEEMDLSAARREVRQLRQTLDNPGALNAYLVRKTLRDFDRMPVLQPNLEHAPVLGPQSAPIEIVIFSDFLCPWCRRFALSLKKHMPTLTRYARVAFVNFPLDKSCNTELDHSLHSSACLIARGAVCAHDQGRFWEFHDHAFEREIEEAEESDVLLVAQDSGLDLDAFRVCLRSPEARARLRSEIVETRRLGVDATPSVMVNGRRLDQATDVLLVVQHELARLGVETSTDPEQ